MNWLNSDIPKCNENFNHKLSKKPLNQLKKYQINTKVVSMSLLNVMKREKNTGGATEKFRRDNVTTCKP